MPSVRIEPGSTANDLDEQRAYLQENSLDHAARLSFARTLFRADEEAESLEMYAFLVGKGNLLEDVIADLEQHVERGSTSELWRLLGDAYMKNGRLEDALDTYRRALQTL